MKKLLAVLTGGILIASSLALTACNGGGNGAGKMPAIPSGVNLSDVADEDMLDKIYEIEEAVEEASGNYKMDFYYKSETHSTGSYTNENKTENTKYDKDYEYLLNLKTFKTEENTFLDAIINCNYEKTTSDTGVKKGDENYDSANYSGKMEQVFTQKIRGEVYTRHLDDGKIYSDGKLLRQSSGLEYYCVDQAYAERPLELTDLSSGAPEEDMKQLPELIKDYLNYKKADDDDFFPTAIDSDALPAVVAAPKKSDFTYNVEVKADDTKLYAKIEFSFNLKPAENADRPTGSCNGKLSLSIYVDVAAELTAKDFDDGKISVKDTANILYLPKTDSISADFLANKEIALNLVGGGNEENAEVRSCYVYYNYEYNGNGGTSRRFNVDAELKDGKLIIPADAYTKLLEQVKSLNPYHGLKIDETKFTFVTIIIRVAYEYIPEEDSNETEVHYCTSEIYFDVK